ncbi:MAG: histidinol dehydrogenase [Clostridiaceae bacterium]|jgi:histidinol dehydrogenase|nr:histidinol dehydrogenase [Clostridiaceae bacterium]
MKIYEYRKDSLALLYEALNKRSPEGQIEVEQATAEIIRNIKERKDEALIEYSKKFDKVELTLDTIEVSQKEMDEALNSIDRNLLKVIEKAAANIQDFHEKQLEKSWFTTNEAGILLGQKVTPLSRVGVYAPAGSAPLPSTVLMDVIPAKVAGVEEIILCSPPVKGGKVDPLILACAKLAGADRVFMVGGAQAIAAMAYGTNVIPKVDKIVGPGNIYVATAKKMVFGTCGIDMIAGPSEILIIADETANPAYVAADLLSQAEHDKLASSILLTTSKEIAQMVSQEVAQQLSKLPRAQTAAESLEKYGAIIVTDTIEDAVEISNNIAPEHLEVCTKNPFDLLSKIKNAGAIFLGNYSPEPLGDYFAGPNHTLPTSGTARFFSPLGVYDFIKRQSIISYSRDAFESAASDVAAFAQSEGLTAHEQAIRIRVNGQEDKKDNITVPVSGTEGK